MEPENTSSVAFNRATIFWVITILVIAAIVYLLKPILFPFAFSVIVAYLLDPVVDKLHKKGISRAISSALIIFGSFIAIIFLSIILLPVLYTQAIDLFRQLPKYIIYMNNQIAPKILEATKNLDIETGQRINQTLNSAINNSIKNVFGLFSTFFANIWHSGVVIINIVALAVVTPVISFYILKDWNKLKKNVALLIPRYNINAARGLIKEIDATLSAYLVGQINVCTVFVLFYGILLTVSGLEFGLLIGILGGILTCIPYVGFFVAFGAGMIVAFFQFDSWSRIAIVGGIFLLGNILEGYFVTPRLIGGKIGIHPAFVIFGLFAGAALFGFVGMVLSLPLTTVFSVIIKFMKRVYMNSQYYKEKA